MSLSDVEVEEFMEKGLLKISPFIQEHLNPAGYDLTSLRGFELKPSEQMLAATVERVELGLEVLGILHIRSSLAREGLFASLALVDPGFRGQLTVSLFNAGKKMVKIERDERFIQISFVRLGDRARKGYGGRYQESEGVVRSRRS